MANHVLIPEGACRFYLSDDSRYAHEKAYVPAPEPEVKVDAYQRLVIDVFREIISIGH